MANAPAASQALAVLRLLARHTEPAPANTRQAPLQRVRALFPSRDAFAAEVTEDQRGALAERAIDTATELTRRVRGPV